MAQDNLLDRYNCGPVKFSGGDNALDQRHLTFDRIVDLEPNTGARFKSNGMSP